MGRELSLYYARRGVACLSLSDIHAGGLAETAAMCEAVASALAVADRDSQLHVEIATLDVRNEREMRAWIEARDAGANGELDLVLAVAGLIESRVHGGRALDDLELGARTIIGVNILGVVNTVMPAVDCMRRRGRGHIGVLSSLAAADGFNSIYPAYAASKAWATAWALGLRAHLRNTGVSVSVFAPGAVRTPLLQPPQGLDPHYDLASRAPSWVAHAPCVELSAATAAAAWAGGIDRDEAQTRPHRCFALVCAAPCLDCPQDVHDAVMRGGCYLLWGWRPRLEPAHAWSVEHRSTAPIDSMENGERHPGRGIAK